MAWHGMAWHELIYDLLLKVLICFLTNTLIHSHINGI